MTLSAGEVLRHELRARRWTQDAFARLLGRPPQWVSEVLCGKKSITPRAALQIGAALGTSAEMWLNLQAAHDVECLRSDRDLKRELAVICQRVRLSEHGVAVAPGDGEAAGAGLVEAGEDDLVGPGGEADLAEPR